MMLGATLLGTSTAGSLAAEVDEATKGGERRPGVALMGLGLYSRGELGPALLKTSVCRFAGVITGSRDKGIAWSRQYGFPEKNIWSYDTIHEIAGNPDIDCTRSTRSRLPRPAST
jgi:glucose-fructose oxidoreductase